MRLRDSTLVDAVTLAGSSGSVTYGTERGWPLLRQLLFGTVIEKRFSQGSRREIGVRRPSTVEDDPRGARARRCGAARPERIARVAVLLVFGVVILGLPGTASAQLCSWDGTPVLPPPEVEFLGSHPDGQRAPARLAVDSHDTIYVADPTRGAVVVRDVHGSVVAVHNDIGVPVAVAVDAFDNIFVSDDSTGRVDIFDAVWQPAGALGVGSGEFVAVTDMAVDPDQDSLSSLSPTVGPI